MDPNTCTPKNCHNTKQVGCPRGYTFFPTLISRNMPSRKGVFVEKFDIQVIKYGSLKIPNICNFWSKMRFSPKKIEKYFFFAQNVLLSIVSMKLKTDFEYALWSVQKRSRGFVDGRVFFRWDY